MSSYRLPSRLRTRRHASPVRHFVAHTKIGRLSSVVLLLFVANMGLYVRFQEQTYPKTALAGHVLGTTACTDLEQKVVSLSVLPTTIKLTHKKTTLAIDPRNLGISLDLPKITASCTDRHSWLPIADVFMSHPLNAAVSVTDSTFARGLEIVKKGFEKEASGAELVIENGLFVLKPSIEGVEIDTAGLKRELVNALEVGQNTLAVPVKTTAPEQTQLDQEHLWEQLVEQQHTAITFNYNGQTKQYTAKEVVTWYVPDKRGYSVSHDKIRAAILQLGEDAKLHITNVDQAVAAVKEALQTHKSLAFTLLGTL